MSARPPAPDLSEQEAAVFARFEAAPVIEEAWDAAAVVRRVAALLDAWEPENYRTEYQAGIRIARESLRYALESSVR